MQCGVIIIKQHDPDCVLRSLKSEAWKGSNENKLPTHFEKEPRLLMLAESSTIIYMFMNNFSFGELTEITLSN